MQPVQLSLIPDPHPAPPATLVEHLPGEAITLLASVIAKAAVGVEIEVACDE